MAKSRRNSGKHLNRLWVVNAKHALYHHDGIWFEKLMAFPGALFDANGFILFQTEEEYLNCPYLRFNKKIGAVGGISNIPGYRKGSSVPNVTQHEAQASIVDNGFDEAKVRMSVAHNNRRQLEVLGEYVTRANIDWFAIFPDKLAERESVADANGRESNLVVYRSRSDDERDHYVIPLTELRVLLTDATLTHSEVNGSVRWNMMLKNHVLKVSHSDLSLNVERYFRVSLAIELRSRNQDTPQPIDLDPPTRVLTTTYRIMRDTAAARQLKADHEHCCQICGITIELPDGTRYAEAHHVRPLGSPHDGPDVCENMIVLCPNHHAMCDYGVIRLSSNMLRRIAGHVVDPEFVCYHNDRVYRPVVANRSHG